MGSPGTLSNIMGRVLTIQIVHRNPRSKPRSQLVARRKCTFGESIQRPYISNFNRAPIMILTRAPAAVAVAAMGMLVFSITLIATVLEESTSMSMMKAIRGENSQTCALSTHNK
jgi:hypothetical protein